MEDKKDFHNSIVSQQRIAGSEETDIDLFQLLSILLKRKVLFFCFFSICVCVGLVYALWKPLVYTYSTPIEIGSTLVNQGAAIQSKIIESPESVLAKINESYIPFAVAQVLQSRGEVFKIKARIPKNSRLVILSSVGTKDMSEVFQELHGFVEKKILQDHQRLIEVPRREYQLLTDQEKIKLNNLSDPRIYQISQKNLLIELDKAKKELVTLDDQKNLFRAQIKRLGETQMLLRTQIEAVGKNLAQVYASQPKAIDGVNDQSQAMTLLMINNQIEQNENRLAELKERLSITLENEKEILQNKIADNRRLWALQNQEIEKLQSELIKFNIKLESEQQHQKNIVASFENKLSEIQETRTLGVAVRSFNVAGGGKKIIVILAGILGLLGGGILVFLAEYLSVVRRRQDTGIEN